MSKTTTESNFFKATGLPTTTTNTPTGLKFAENKPNLSQISKPRPRTSLKRKEEPKVLLSSECSFPRPSGVHCGYTFSRRHKELLLVENNAINNKPILIRSGKADSNRESPDLEFEDFGPKEFFSCRGTFDRKKIVSMLRQHYKIADKNSTECQPKQELQKQDSLRESEAVDLSQTPEPKCFEKTSIFKKPSRPQSAKLKPSRPLSSTFAQRPRTTKYPYVNSITNDKPYEDPLTQKLKQERVQKKKWVSQKDFNLVSQKKKSFSQPSYLHNSPYNPPSAHKFRNENKKKWLAGSFKIAQY